MDDGSNRYVFNRLSGEIDGREIQIFDYHYDTYSRDSKGRRSTHHHYIDPAAGAGVCGGVIQDVVSFRLVGVGWLAARQ
ncbi:MAG: hypothetical protein ACOCVJ_03790 [Verrucomicrobiota bacterium]